MTQDTKVKNNEDFGYLTEKDKMEEFIQQDKKVNRYQL